MKTTLTHSQQSTYDAVFQHPVARNLDWYDVRALLGAVAEVTTDSNGSFKFTRNGQSLLLRSHREKEVADVDELMRIRHFLQPAEPPPPQEMSSGILRLLVVLDHREARIYRAEVHGSVPEHVAPYDPLGTARHLHYVEDESFGQRKPELKKFYEAIIRTVSDADQLLLFGHGKGAASAMDHLLNVLKADHPRLAACVVGSVVVDDHRLTESQLLAKARDLFKAAAPVKS